MSTWYKPTEHGWSKYKSGKVGYYKGRGRGTISVKPRTMWKTKSNYKQNTGLKSFWFKEATYLSSDTAGFLDNQPGISTNSVQLVSDFASIAQNFMQYQIVKMIIRWVPVNLNNNGAQELQGAQIGRPLFQRGTLVCWTDIDGLSPYPLNVDEIINKPSTKIINPMRQYKRVLTRPRGYPKWGELSDTGGVIIGDEWKSKFSCFGENFSPQQATGQQRYFIQVAQFEVKFRGRR